MTVEEKELCLAGIVKEQAPYIASNATELVDATCVMGTE
jgi:hypothetical protein